MLAGSHCIDNEVAEQLLQECGIVRRILSKSITTAKNNKESFRSDFMGSRFYSEYVYAFDENNEPHFVMLYYGANLGDSYRSDIYLPNKSYCVLDLFLTDESETEGEFLPHVKQKEWEDFLPSGPSENVSTIMAEAGMGELSVSKMVYIYMESSSRSILEYDGFVSTAQGVRTFGPDVWAQAFAQTQTGSAAQQERDIALWIAGQVQNRNL